MDASKQVVYIHLDAQDPRQQSAQVVEFDDIDSIAPTQFAGVAANESLLEHADAIEIELDAEQIDALLAGRWVP